MSKTNTYENQTLDLLFNSTLASHMGTLATTGNTNLYISLHTADPTETGSYADEATYTGYARVAVARTVGGWTVSGGQAASAALIQFPQCTGGSSLVTHVAIGTSASGGTMLYSGALSSSLNISNGIQPQFSAGTLVVTED